MSKILQRRNPEGSAALAEALQLSRIERELAANRKRLPLAIAKYFINSRQLDSAELLLDHALGQAASDKPFLIELIIEKAEVAKQEEKYARAWKYLAKAAALGREVGDSALSAAVSRKEGDIAALQKDYLTALEKYEQAKSGYSENNDIGATARVAVDLGRTAFKMLDFKHALESYQGAAESAGDDIDLSVCARVGVVEALTALSRHGDAIELCETIEKEIRNLPASERVKKEYLFLLAGKKAINLSLQGHIQEAHAIKVKQLSNAATSRKRAILCAELAEAEFLRGQPEKAKFYDKEAGVYRQGIDDDFPDMLLPLSRLNSMRGDIHAAEQQLFDAIIELPDSLGTAESLPYDLHKITLRVMKGELGAATVLANQLYDIFSDIKPAPLVLTSILAKLGDLALIQGETEMTQMHYEAALVIATALASPAARAQALSGLARAKTAQFKFKEALELASAALKIVQNIGEMKLFRHSLLLQRADVLNKAVDGDPDEKRDRVSDLLETGYCFESIPLDLQATLSLGILSWHESRDEEMAISYFEETAATAEEHGLLLMEMFSKGLLGSLLQDMGERARATDLLSETLSKMQDLGLALPAREDFEQRFRDLTGFAF